MVERHHKALDERQLAALSDEALANTLKAQTEELGQFGVNASLEDLYIGVQGVGPLYENVKTASGRVRITGLNLQVAIEDESQVEVPQGSSLQWRGVIAHTAMVMEEFCRRSEGRGESLPIFPNLSGDQISEQV